MLEEKIKQKLKGVLSNPIKKESQVVYFLAEVRKLLEGTKDKGKEGTKDKGNFKVLWFYCSWVLHFEMGDTSLFEEIEKECFRHGHFALLNQEPG